MAIAGIPQNLAIQQGNRQILITWDMSVGATSYAIQRSTDGITYSAYDTATVAEFVDTVVVVGTMYYYKVASVNTDGTSAYASPVKMAIAPNGEMSLYELRLRAQQRADRVNSNFVSTTEWNFFLMQACYELYDLLIDVYEDYYSAPEVGFSTNGSQYYYDLPDGLLPFTNTETNQTVIAPPFYKLLGVDLAVNQTNNAYVTINKYNLIDRNKFVYPNTASTIYGVFNLQYRVMGSRIRFIPTPSGNQIIRLLYAPRLPQLLQDTDVTTIGFSGWLQYVIVRAAKYALDKEESPTDSLDQELLFLKSRIEAAASNRDAGQPDKISDIRSGNGWGYNDWGNGSFKGGFAFLPGFLASNAGHGGLSHSILSGQFSLGNVLLGITLSYLGYLCFRKLGGRISFSGARNFTASCVSTFLNHIRHIFGVSSKKKMTRIDTESNVTSVTDLHAIRNISVVENPGSTVSFNSTTLPAGTVSASTKSFINHQKNTVAVNINLSIPHPARGSLSNFRDKPVGINKHSAIIPYDLRKVKHG